MEKITKIQRTIETIQYSAKCSKCGKKIVGSAESQVRFNLAVHKSGKECK